MQGAFPVLKRIAAAICAFVAVLLVLGCSFDGTAQSSSAAASKPVLKIGIDIYEPYTYYDDNGQLTGIDYEIAVEACNRLGVTPEFVGISWEKKNDLLASGEIDCVWSCYSMTGREDSYLWAGPYMNSYQAAVVRTDSGITSLSQLEGKRVAVEATTKSEEAWVKHGGDVVPQASDVLTYTTSDEVLSAVQLGYADAASSHVGPMSALVASSGGTLTLLPEGFYATQIGVAFDKGYADPSFVEHLDQTLTELEEDGTIAAVAEKYGLDPSMVVEGAADAQ